MEVLHQGSRNDQVKLLQRLLNKRRVVKPALKEDGVFGPKTRQAVTTFQSQEHIAVDGVAGAQTWQRLGIRYDVTHPVQLFPQPTNMTCWSASATMILGNMSVGPGQAAIPGGGLDPSPHNVEVFARGLGWRMYSRRRGAFPGWRGCCSANLRGRSAAAHRRVGDGCTRLSSADSGATGPKMRAER